MIYKTFNIKYDTDELNQKDLNLPEELIFDITDDDFEPAYELADYISDKTGWCVESFEYTEI